MVLRGKYYRSPGGGSNAVYNKVMGPYSLQGLMEETYMLPIKDIEEEAQLGLSLRWATLHGRY